MRLHLLCRGSSSEGLGHLYRAKSIARVAARHHDVELTAIAPEHLRVLLADAACPCHFVDQDDDAVARIAAAHPDVLVYDLVGLAGSALRALRDTARLHVSISPVFEHMAAMDAVVSRFSPANAGADTQLFTGLDYAVFNENCIPISDIDYRRNLDHPYLPVAICMGGGDHGNKTLKVLEAVTAAACPTVTWVFVGEGYEHNFGPLVDTVAGSLLHEVIVCKTNRSMWRVMQNCCLAVFAGGLSTLEAAYAGLPSIAIFDGQDKQDLTRDLIDRGVTLDGGVVRFNGDLDRLTAMVEELAAAPDRLWQMRQRAHGLIDGQGAARSLVVMEKLLQEKSRPQ